MRIDFEQTGGFANITFRFSTDLGDLPDEEANELRSLVEASGILEGIPSGPATAQAGLTYRVRITDGPRTGPWQGTDTTLPEQLVPLIERLSELAVQAAKTQR